MSKYDGLTLQELRSLVDDRAWDLQTKAEQVVQTNNLKGYAETYKAIEAVRTYANILEEALEALEEKEQEEEAKEYEDHY